MDTNKGFIKLPRGLLDLPLSHNPQQFVLFIHLLLRANREIKEWNGIMIERGSVVTSLRSLSRSCGLSIWQVRASLKALVEAGLTHVTTHNPTSRKGGHATHDPSHGFTVVSICNYDSFEGIPFRAHTRNHTRSTDGNTHDSTHDPTTTKENKEIDIIKDIVDDALFIPIVSEWLAYKQERGEAYKGKRGITQFYNRLKRLSGGDPTSASRIVHNSMASNYAGVFPERHLREGSRTLISSAKNNRSKRISLPDASPEEYVSTI